MLLATGTAVVYVHSTDSALGQLLFMREGMLMAQPFDDKRLELTGEAVPVANQVGYYSDSGYFSASTNGVLVYMLGINGGNARLTWVDRQGKTLGSAGDPAEYNEMVLSPDGTRAAVRRFDFQKMNLWLLDFVPELSRRFTFEGFPQSPVWSPDGSSIGHAPASARRTKAP